MKKTIFFMLAVLYSTAVSFAQSVVADKSIRYQQERMVYKQWDQNKFTPTSGFLGLNPWYWLTWGFFYPNYHKKDLRPLSANGPQTQRLALVGTMNGIDYRYKQESDTIRNTAVSEIADQSGLITAADPLWALYYSREFKPVLEHSVSSILGGLDPQVRSRLLSDGIYDWYNNELDRLKERIEAAHTIDMERGSRIMAYYRMLNEYRTLSGVWATRTASCKMTMEMERQQRQLNTGTATVPVWTPQTDIQIAKEVLKHVQ
ncbi:hypothetical protein D0C36_19245 [Mucilaginibacter conchicola]|uniref:DUF5045 domain-containing protein n=1 Tax=Mucilaginibacter conchicola TaxID=2303333 RepID=A0A372NR13_9SPHI|nr:hypothetical protein [Mucilaginibacter conchicola]RFZ91080.1 hypothetical protein D0C36_19245 [Mucilaginibacter conchicola]